MLILFAVLFGGILTGRLLRRRPLRALGSVITFIIWLLLFMLGTEVGGNEEVMRSLATLGVQALVLCTGALAGSIACAWLLWRSIGGRRTGATDSAAPAPPAFAALSGSLVIVAFFAAGAIFGIAGWIPATAASSPVSTYMLYGLMFSVGVSLGHDATLVERIRSLDRRMALLPICTVVGTLAGAALASPLLHTVPPADAMAVGAGFGYYSLSSIFISELRSVELGTVALHAAGRTVGSGPFRAAGRDFVGRRHDLRYHPPDPHPRRRAAVCRRSDLPRLRHRFQRSLPGHVLLFDLKKRDAPTDASRLKKSCFAPYCSTGESKPSFRKPFCTSGWLMKSRHNNSERWFSIITAIGP